MDAEKWINRDRGVLTKKDRRYLFEDYDPDSKTNVDRQREYRMRKHLRHSLIDFQIVANFYNGLFEPVFDDINDPENNVLSADDPLRRGIEGVFTLLYHGLSEFDYEEGLDDHRFSMLLNRGVSEAVEREYAFEGLSVRPARTLFKVNGTEPAVPLETLAREFKQGERLRNDEMKHLFWGGWVPHEMYIEYDGLADIDELREEHGDDEFVDVLNSMYEDRKEKRRQAADEDAPTEPEYGGFVRKSYFED